MTELARTGKDDDRHASKGKATQKKTMVASRSSTDDENETRCPKKLSNGKYA